MGLGLGLASATGATDRRPIRAIEPTRQSEVADAKVEEAAAPVEEEHVLWLEVPVDDVMLVNGLAPILTLAPTLTIALTLTLAPTITLTPTLTLALTCG